jgi:hypothetical protein
VCGSRTSSARAEVSGSLRVESKPALADAGLARDEQDAAAAAERVGQRVVEGRELARTAHEHPAGRCALGHRGGGGEVELLVLVQDRLMQLAQRAPRLDPELLDQRRARGLVGLERIRLAPGAIEGEHQLCVQPLAQRMPGGERLEPTDDSGVLAGGEVGVDPLLERAEAQLLELRRVRPGEGLVGEVGQRRPAPQRKRLAQPRGRGRGIGVGRLRDQRLKTGQVELGRPDVEHIAGRAGHQPAVAELLAHARDVDLDALRHRGRRRLAPHLVHEALGRDDVVGIQQEHRQHRTLLAPAEREHPVVVVDDLQRP